MNNQQTPTGEAQNGQEKVWYKKWWVILIGIIILLPFFWVIVPIGLIWLVATKGKNWSKKTRGLVGAGLVIFLIIIIASAGSDDGKKKEVAKQEAPVSQPQAQEVKEEASEPKEQAQAEIAQVQAQSQPEVAQAPQNTFTFDVPTLISKNIDEVKATLGNPTDFTTPTKQQLAMFDTWDMGYTKDGVNLLIEYNPKSKVVIDFFIDGNDKNKLLTQGNLQEGNDAYAVEFVKNVSNPNEILGVKITKKLSSELNANVTFNALAFKIENKEDYNWYDCKFELNGGGKIFSGGYEYKSSSGIKAKDSVVIPFSEFTKDSKRFDYLSEKPENLFISCNTNGQHRTSYMAIN